MALLLRLWRLSLSDDESSESLDSEELRWSIRTTIPTKRLPNGTESLLTVDHADVGSRSVVVGSPSCGHSNYRGCCRAANCQARWGWAPGASPSAGALLLVANRRQGEGDLLVNVEESESLPTSSSARSDSFRPVKDVSGRDAVKDCKLSLVVIATGLYVWNAAPMEPHLNIVISTRVWEDLIG